VTVLAVVAALTACQSDGGSGETGELTVLSEDQLDDVVLSEDNVGPDFTVDEGDDDDEPSPGCLGALDQVDDVTDNANSSEVSYAADNDFGLPSVFSGAASFESTKKVTGLIDDLESAFDDCRQVNETDDDGTTYDLVISTDTEKTSAAGDQQLNIDVNGTIGSEGLSLPFNLATALVRVDNHLLMVATGDVDEEAIGLVEPLTEIAISRLQSVLDDEEPTDERVEAASSGDDGEDSGEPEDEGDGSDDGEGSFESLPLDGGSFTWDSTRITMTLSVERVEPWGKKDDFCGDGSCGVADPDDTRFVLKYEVAVPADYPEPFDPYACPGEMHTTSGADDEALSSVYGEYEVALGGKVFPGESKFGVVEYYIEKAYAGGEFYIESTCGTDDEDFTSAYFVGPIADLV
jgi:hypothetical protein